VDEDGFVYIVWQDMRSGKAEIWFATNRLTGITEPEEPGQTIGIWCNPVISKNRVAIHIVGIDHWSWLAIFNKAGRQVRTLTDGKRDSGWIFCGLGWQG